MKDILIMFGILALWIALNRWILPAFGVQTCMSGACQLNRAPASTVGAPVDENAVETQADPR